MGGLRLLEPLGVERVGEWGSGKGHVFHALASRFARGKQCQGCGGEQRL
jgi:hypothetical protein